MRLKVLAAAVVMGATALTPAIAVAASGGFYWSPDGSGVQSSSLQDPQSGRCYTLRGNSTPFYAYNATNRTVHYYRSSGCSGYVGSVSPDSSGNVTRYVKFD